MFPPTETPETKAEPPLERLLISIPSKSFNALMFFMLASPSSTWMRPPWVKVRPESVTPSPRTATVCPTSVTSFMLTLDMQEKTSGVPSPPFAAKSTPLTVWKL